MFKKTNRLAAGLMATAAASVTVLSMTATGAQAATTFTPSGGPGANFVGSYNNPTDSPDLGIVSGIRFTDIPADQSLDCSAFSVGGSIVSPGTSRAYGANAGNLGSLTASGCTNPLAGATSVTPIGTWGVTVTGDAVSGQWPARLTNVKAKLSAANCDFYVEGVVNGKFNTSTQVFTPVGNPVAANATSYTPTGLVIASTPAPPTGSMCTTLDLQVGDDIGITGTFKNTPPSGSTALAITNP
ncbi:hypothetical protein F9L07_27145 [Pimelobacter simplex]|uniref:Secreted protein n=1 Tax=Nocardioides simplex TaxID=2045 RepID=A0A7J5DQZ7_NOCSI|nr:hypothetical protein [Pimelobacter simplex]KAB2807172.1 hypothetical protein F9L07_27145 [Pimelobacter simplex]